MKKQLTGNALLSIPPGQVWSLEMHQRLTETPSFASLAAHSPPAQILTNDNNHRMEGLSNLVARFRRQKQAYFQELNKVCFSPVQQFLPATEFIFPTYGGKLGRPFKKPSFPIKAIWCKTVICLMDMECDLPERLDFTVSALHGLPRYLTSREDYIFNRSAEAQKARWKVYSPLRNYVGPEIEDMVEFICAIDGCNQFFKTRDLVVNHVFGVHKLFPPTVFKCNWAQCEREDHFGAFYQVEHHMSLHKEERPYLCTTPGCPKSYRRLENLRTHMRTHSGEKPYKCKFDFCDRRFTNASDRAKHENRTHSTVKGFGCYFDDCFKMYTDPSSLRKHIINAHGAEAYSEHKKNKAVERKKKIAQKMMERNVCYVPKGSGGPIRSSSRCPSISSQSSLTTGEFSMSPRSSSSNDSSEMGSSSEISPLPTVSEASTPTTQPAISGGINFSISRIMEGIPRPSPPPTTPMYDLVKPIPRTTLFPSPQKLPQLPPLTNLRLLPPLFPVQSLSSLVPPVINPVPLLSPQMQFLLAHMQPININRS